MKYYFIVPKYFGKREVYIIPKENIWTPDDVCPKCGGTHLKTSVPAKIMLKGSPCDFYENSGKLFISSKFLQVFQRLKLTGYEVLPVEIKLNNTDLNPDELHYYELTINGKCGYAMDINRKFLRKCDLCGRRLPIKERIHGLYFDELKYNGTDIFTFNNLENFPIVSEALKRQITKEKLSNIKFVELSEMEIM